LRDDARSGVAISPTRATALFADAIPRRSVGLAQHGRRQRATVSAEPDRSLQRRQQSGVGDIVGSARREDQSPARSDRQSRTSAGAAHRITAGDTRRKNMTIVTGTVRPA
jgi:hypothetical protein